MLLTMMEKVEPLAVFKDSLNVKQTQSMPLADKNNHSTLPPNINDILSVSKCTINKPNRDKGRKFKSRKLTLRANNMGTIRETNEPDNTTTTFIHSAKADRSLNNENLFNTNMHCNTEVKASLRQTLKRHSLRFHASSQEELKSGILVLISQHCNSKDIPANTTNNINRDGNNIHRCIGAPVATCNTFSTSGRTPVVLKVFCGSLGKYAIMTSSRQRSSQDQRFCLRLKRSRVVIDATTSTSTAANNTCMFTLTTGGDDDGKSFRFEATSREAAYEWANVMSSTSTKTAQVLTTTPCLMLSPVSEYTPEDYFKTDNNHTIENNSLGTNTSSSLETDSNNSLGTNTPSSLEINDNTSVCTDTPPRSETIDNYLYQSPSSDSASNTASHIFGAEHENCHSRLVKRAGKCSSTNADVINNINYYRNAHKYDRRHNSQQISSLNDANNINVNKAPHSYSPAEGNLHVWSRDLHTRRIQQRRSDLNTSFSPSPVIQTTTLPTLSESSSEEEEEEEY